MDSSGLGYSEQTFQIGDLGRFSMRAIYDALSHNEHLNDAALPRRPSRQDDPEDSDCSWTQEDDGGTFYFDMQKKLNSFASSTEPTMTTAFLSKSQRRFVHATAQILKLGHASLGPPGKLRSMIVFKYQDAQLPSAEAQASTLDTSTTVTTFAALSSPSKKRRRLERVENGFPCHHCEKVFDRASERTKHEQAHQPNLTSRFQCTICNKGFRYPKDLRRHNKVHERAAAAAGTQSLSSSYESGQVSSTFTAESRVTSNTSLTFASHNASTNVSPLLFGCSGEGIPELDLDPLMLDENEIMRGEDWLLDCQPGYWDADGEDFLEMARVRK